MNIVTGIFCHVCARNIMLTLDDKVVIFIWRLNTNLSRLPEYVEQAHIKQLIQVDVVVCIELGYYLLVK